MAASTPQQLQQQHQQRSTLATPPSSLQHGGSRPSSASGVPVLNPWSEYESLGIIGRGKYSEVHRARSRRTGELVAVKKVQIFEMDSDGRKEVSQEAEGSALKRHSGSGEARLGSCAPLLRSLCSLSWLCR